LPDRRFCASCAASIPCGGCERDVFSSDALAYLHEASHGHLRDLDRIANACLKLGQRKRVKVVDRELVVRAQAVSDAGDDS
jgi:histone H3/H4